MSTSPFHSSRFTKQADCTPCCEEATIGCDCSLPIPITGFPGGFTISPVADEAAATALLGSIQVSNCVGFCEWDGAGVFSSFTADLSTPDEIVLTAIGNPDNAPQCQARMWVSLSLKAGSIVTVASSAGGGLASGGSALYSCDGTLIHSESGATQTHTVPTDGEYYLFCAVTSTVAGFGGGSDTLVADVTCDDTMTVYPVVAQFDGLSGTQEKECLVPECSRECLSEKVSEFCDPESGASCTAFYQADTPCGEVNQSASVRLVLTNLIPGVTYQATVTVSCSGCGPLVGSGTTLTWCFVAESDTETTDYQGIAIEVLDGCTCEATTCTVGRACSCA